MPISKPGGSFSPGLSTACQSGSFVRGVVRLTKVDSFDRASFRLTEGGSSFVKGYYDPINVASLQHSFYSSFVYAQIAFA